VACAKTAGKLVRETHAGYKKESSPAPWGISHVGEKGKAKGKEKLIIGEVGWGGALEGITGLIQKGGELLPN